MVKLRQFRKAKGLTQVELAQAARVSFMSIHRYEAGERIPSVDIADRIAKALGCTVDDLIDKEAS